MNQLSINPLYSSNLIKSTWSGTAENTGKLDVMTEPYSCGILKDFICFENSDHSEFFASLRQEIDQLTFNRKENDLMALSQSADLTNLDKDTENADKYRNINAIRTFLSTSVRKWMSEVSGIELRGDYIPLTASIYNFTDHLLCHDDELEDRRIAFVIYLSSEWTPADGGTLDIFDSNDSDEPAEIRHRLCPTENSFSFFKVSSKSFHQVAEVLNESSKRISINGWFHGEPLHREKKSSGEALSIAKPLPDFELAEFMSWINPWYLAEGNHPQISKKFGRDSQIELVDFLKEDKYEAICEELKAEKYATTPVSIPNKRNFTRLKQTEGSCLEQCLKFMRSESMFLILSQLTGITFHPMAKKSKTEPIQGGEVDSKGGSEPSSSKKRKISQEYAEEEGSTPIKSNCSYQFRHFVHKDYTLLHDEDSVLSDTSPVAGSKNDDGDEEHFCLDAQLFFTKDKWTPAHGGYTCYVAKDDEEEILTVEPRGNSLALVYRDSSTMRFVKYLNQRVNKLSQPGFFDLSMVYYSGYEDDGGSSESESDNSHDDSDDLSS